MFLIPLSSLVVFYDAVETKGEDGFIVVIKESGDKNIKCKSYMTEI
jgi:hypothetical protein